MLTIEIWNILTKCRIILAEGWVQLVSCKFNRPW